MDSHNLSLIIILVLCVIISAYFSATETAFSSLNRIRIKNMAADGNKKAAMVLKLIENYDRLLSSILIGNNVVNIASASIATVVFVSYFGNAGVTISTVVMTVVVLIFGEISPKSLAKDAPETFAMATVSILRVIIVVLTPVNFIFMQWKKLLSKLFKVKETQGVTEEELLTIVDEAESTGGIDQQESELIKSAIEFNDLDVMDILTPRVEVVAIPDTIAKDELRQTFLESGYSRLPVYKEDVDDIIGVINQKDFHNYISRTDQPLKIIIKPVVYTIATMKISKLLKQLQQKKSHMAVVMDEYGGTVGIVTLEDILEELVGEIWDEHDEVVQEFEKLDDYTYIVSGSANLDKIFVLFDQESESEANTISGWVSEELGKIPSKGDIFEYENLRVEVIEVVKRRAEKVKIEVFEIIKEEDE